MIDITDNTDDDHLTFTGGSPHIRPDTSVVEVGMEKCGKSHVCYRSNRLDSGSSSGGGGTGHAQWRPVLTSEGGQETGHEY